MTAHVDDREHDTVAEPIINMSLFAAADQTGIHEFLARVAFGRHRIDERVEGIRCIAESETVHRPSGQTSVDKILLCGSVFRPPECVIIIASGIPAERVQTLSVARRFALGFALFGYLHARPLGEIAYRIREGQTFRLHNKGDDTAACAAAEAVKDLLVRRDRKRTGFLVVEGTQTEIVRAALFQLHILRDHVHDVVARGQLVQKDTVKRHFVPLLPYLSNENEYMIPIFVNPQSYSSFSE